MGSEPQLVATTRVSCKIIHKSGDVVGMLAWPVATYGCESWTFRKNEETRLDPYS